MTNSKALKQGLKGSEIVVTLQSALHAGGW